MIKYTEVGGHWLLPITNSVSLRQIPQIVGDHGVVSNDRIGLKIKINVEIWLDLNQDVGLPVPETEWWHS